MSEQTSGETGTALRFGLPSKGRLQEQTGAFLASAGIEFKRTGGSREYAGALVGIDGVEIVFLQAGEMPSKLAQGEIHIGVTGEDVVREKLLAWENQVQLLKPLGFGHADLVVAVPKCWIDVATLADLDDVAADFRRRHGHRLRVATKYLRSARAFFGQRGVTNVQLVESQGATEGLVAAGAAEAVIDITSSGETLHANHLKILDDGLILKSEAQLCAAYNANWSPRALTALRHLLERIDGRSSVVGNVEIRARIDRSDVDRAEAALTKIGARLTQRPLKGFPGQALVSVEGESAGLVVDILIAAGAAAVETSSAPSLSQASELGLFEGFVARLEHVTA